MTVDSCHDYTLFIGEWMGNRTLRNFFLQFSEPSWSEVAKCVTQLGVLCLKHLSVDGENTVWGLEDLAALVANIEYDQRWPNEPLAPEESREPEHWARFKKPSSRWRHGNVVPLSKQPRGNPKIWQNIIYTKDHHPTSYPQWAQPAIPPTVHEERAISRSPRIVTKKGNPATSLKSKTVKAKPSMRQTPKSCPRKGGERELCPHPIPTPQGSPPASNSDSSSAVVDAAKDGRYDASALVNAAFGSVSSVSDEKIDDISSCITTPPGNVPALRILDDLFNNPQLRHFTEFSSANSSRLSMESLASPLKDGPPFIQRKAGGTAWTMDWN